MKQAQSSTTWVTGLNSQWAIRLTLVLLGCCAAALVGYWVGTEEWRLLIVCLFVFAGVVVVVGMRRRAWVLIPLAWSAVGYTTVLPVPFSGRDISIILAVVAYVACRVLMRIKGRQKVFPLDWILGLNLAYLLVTLLINPVGFSIFGAGTIGARPYVSIFLSAAAYWVLLRMPDSVKTVSHIPVFVVISALSVSFLYLTTYLIPSAPTYLPYLYAALDVATFSTSLVVQGEIPRYGQLADGGLMLVLLLCVRYTPQTLLQPFRLRFYVLLLALAAILAAGFRNVLLTAMVFFVLSAILHRVWARMVLAFALSGLLLGCLLVGQGRLYELPMAAQRTLSYLPGQWSQTVIDDAENSSQGRFKWWRDVVKYGLIKNWSVGDGFGANAADLALAAASGSNVEFIFLAGGFHSGPLTTIRYVGIVGLILIYALMLSTAHSAIRCVKLSRGTVLHAAAMFVAVQAIWTPFYFTVVFGAYNVDMPRQIFLAGLTRLLMRMIEQPAALTTSTDSVRSGLSPITPRAGAVG